MLFSRLPVTAYVAFTDGITIKAANERLSSGVLYAFSGHGWGGPRSASNRCQSGTA